MPDPALLQIFFANAPDLLCVAGFDGRFRHLNPSWTRVLGWSEAELLARPWIDLVHPADREATLAVGARLAAGETAVDFRNRYRCKDGSWRLLAWNSYPLPEQGLIMAVTRDITESEALRVRLAETEARLAAVLDHAPFGLHLWRAEPDGRLVFAAANGTADRFTGAPSAPMIGKPIEEAFPDTVSHGLPGRYRAVAEGRAPAFKLAGIPYRDGRISGFFDVWAFQAGPRHCAAFFIEITDRMQAEETLRRSREDLRITLDSIGDAVIATDCAARVTRINPVAQRMTGWSEGEALGRHVDEVFDIVNAESGKRVESPVSRVLREGQVVGLANHTALVRRDGQRVQIADSGAPIRGADGAIAGVVLVFRDVTEEYALQRQLHQAQKMEAIGQLAGGIAHDFNNLLAGIMGASELLARRAPPAGREREWLASITNAATRAAELTQKLLAFGRKGQAQTVAVDIKALVHQVSGILEHTLDRRIVLRLDLPPAPVWVRGDPSQLQSAILNLAINARDAMPGGGSLRIALAEAELLAVPPCRHHMGAIQPGAFAALAVTDTGCGIPGEIVDRIFEPFFTTKGPGEGSGLGLANTYTAIRNHAGAITVDSETGHGSTFTLYLPLGSAPDAQPASGRIARLAGAGKRILVVDDEPALRGALCAWLVEEGFTVVEAGDGAEGVQRFATAEPAFDLVLLDLVLPTLSGPDAFRAMRQRQPNARILLMSGYNLHGARADALLTEGAAGFLQKPFRFEDLAGTLARLLG